MNLVPKSDKGILMLINDPTLKSVIGAIIRLRNQDRKISKLTQHPPSLIQIWNITENISNTSD